MRRGQVWHLQCIAIGREDVQDLLRIPGNVLNWRPGLQWCRCSKCLPLKKSDTDRGVTLHFTGSASAWSLNQALQALDSLYALLQQEVHASRTGRSSRQYKSSSNHGKSS